MSADILNAVVQELARRHSLPDRLVRRLIDEAAILLLERVTGARDAETLRLLPDEEAAWTKRWSEVMARGVFTLGRE